MSLSFQNMPNEMISVPLLACNLVVLMYLSTAEGERVFSVGGFSLERILRKLFLI